MAADAVYARAEGNHNIEKIKGGQDPMQPTLHKERFKQNVMSHPQP